MKRIRIFQFPLYTLHENYLAHHHCACINIAVFIFDNNFKSFYTFQQFRVQTDNEHGQVYIVYSLFVIFHWKSFLVCDQFCNGNENNWPCWWWVLRNYQNFESNIVWDSDCLLDDNHNLVELQLYFSSKHYVETEQCDIWFELEIDSVLYSLLL